MYSRPEGDNSELLQARHPSYFAMMDSLLDPEGHTNPYHAIGNTSATIIRRVLNI